MKTLANITMTSVIILISSLSLAQTFGTKNINLTLEYAELEASVACVEYYDPRWSHEEDTRHVQMFYMGDSFAKHKELVEKGYSPLYTLKDGTRCGVDTKDMKRISVTIFTKATDILDMIRDQNTAINGTVIYYKSGELRDEFQAAIDATVKSLFDSASAESYS